MPPNRFSRHRFETAQTDADGKLYLSERTHFPFRDLPDNRHHVVRQGDSWWTLAATYFAGLPRPAGLWWAVADYQPTPCVDPTIALVPGTLVVVPSMRTVEEELFNERRRSEGG